VTLKLCGDSAIKERKGMSLVKPFFYVVGASSWSICTFEILKMNSFFNFFD